MTDALRHDSTAREDPVKRRAILVAGLVAGAVLLPGSGAAQVRAEDRALLAQTNLFATAPEQFHARVGITRSDGARALRMELWRDGRDRLLARTLEASQAGRFLLQLGGDHFLIAPGARQPVKLGPNVGLAGGMSSELLLGLDVERDFELTRAQSSGRIVTLFLQAKPGTTAARATPAARWVVDRDRRLPLRVDVLLADGRTARVIEFVSFLPDQHGVPGKLVLKDVLRGGAPVTVEIEAFEVVPVPDGLFSLSDPSSRAALPPLDVKGQ